MKILHIITRLDCGGSAENTLLTAIGFAEKGHDVTILYGIDTPTSDNQPKAIYAGVKLVRCKYLVRAISPYHDILAFLSLYQHLRKYKYDIIHTHTSKAGIIGRFSGKCAGVKNIIHTPHGHIFYGYFTSFLTRIFIFLERLTMHWTDTLITLTQQEKEDYIAQGIGKDEQIQVIYSGIPLQPFLNMKVKRGNVRKQYNVTPKHFLCITVARLEPVKNHELIIAAAHILKKVLPVIRFMFVGEGSQRQHLENQIKDRELKEFFYFTGWRKDVHTILPLADCFVLCSKNEGMGRAFVEAQAAGLPVIGSRVCGIPEVVIEGETGFLVDDDSPEKLAEYIERLYNEKGKRNAKIRKCRSWVNPQFSVESMIAKIDDLYVNTLQRVY